MELSAGSPDDEQRLLALGTEWGNQLSPAQYAAREHHVLRASPWARAALTRWAWQAPGGPVLASCETFWMRGLSRRQASPEACVVLGVGSVYTPPPLRGNGYASALLQALAARSADAAALVLMSEAGPAFYERLGFTAPKANPWDWAFCAAPGGVQASAAEESDAESADSESFGAGLLSLVDNLDAGLGAVMRGVVASLAAIGLAAPPLTGHRDIFLPDLPEVAAAIAKLATRDLAGDLEPGGLAVIPSADQLVWHIARADARRAALGQPPVPGPQPCGARCGDAKAVWALDVERDAEAESYSPVLRILVLVAGRSPEHTAAALAAAVAAAAAAGAPRGRTLAWDCGTLQAGSRAGRKAWEPPAAQLAARGVLFQQEGRRCESLPMVRGLLASPVRAQGWAWVPRGVWM